MAAPANVNGGGYMPSQNFSHSRLSGGGYAPAAFGEFPSTLEAVAALPPRLNKVVWNLHHRYGVPLDIALGNVIAVLSFVCQGVSNVRDSKGDPMPLSTIVHVVGAPHSGKSATFLRLMQAVNVAMHDWPHQWDFEDSTPQGIKRVSPLFGLCATEEGDAFFRSALGKDLALQISLRDGYVPVSTRAKHQDGDRTKKAATRFTIVVLIQPDRYDEWLDRNHKKAVGQGFLQRVWMVRSFSKSDKNAIGRYPLSEGALDDWDARVSELLERAKSNGNSGLAGLFALDVATDASYVLHEAQCRMDSLDEQGLFHDASAMAARYHERVSVLAALFHLYEGEGRVINRAMMSSAVVVAAYLAGQWLGIVLPPKPVPQEQQDAQTLLPNIYEELRHRGVGGIRESDIVTLAKNLGWPPQRTKAALAVLYAAGQLKLLPRTINGRRVEMVELPRGSLYLPTPH